MYYVCIYIYVHIYLCTMYAYIYIYTYTQIHVYIAVLYSNICLFPVFLQKMMSSRCHMGCHIPRIRGAQCRPCLAHYPHSALLPPPKAAIWGAKFRTFGNVSKFLNHGQNWRSTSLVPLDVFSPWQHCLKLRKQLTKCFPTRKFRVLASANLNWKYTKWGFGNVIQALAAHPKSGLSQSAQGRLQIHDTYIYIYIYVVNQWLIYG